MSATWVELAALVIIALIIGSHLNNWRWTPGLVEERMILMEEDACKPVDCVLSTLAASRMPRGGAWWSQNATS